ncbi:periplasmic chorismate mutase I [Klebsiella michiganensis]|uniref:Periplasmic chorismate mutase I n=1 Tax=Klebsiella michiganensis TaxID=1134687 RepID=A0A7H4N0J5_9ENTR|nr:periplasmic chorismate mutase I [Klebsiella michiganensis]
MSGRKSANLAIVFYQSVAARLKSGQPLTEQGQEAFMHAVQQKNLHEQDKHRIWETMKGISLKD